MAALHGHFCLISRRLHCVEIVKIYCWYTTFSQKFREINGHKNYKWKIRQNTRSLFLLEIQHFFRQIKFFTKEVTKELISRKFFSVIVFYSTFPYCENWITVLAVFTKHFSSESRFLVFTHCECLPDNSIINTFALSLWVMYVVVINCCNYTVHKNCKEFVIVHFLEANYY